MFHVRQKVRLSTQVRVEKHQCHGDEKAGTCVMQKLNKWRDEKQRSGKQREGRGICVGLCLHWP